MVIAIIKLKPREGRWFRGSVVQRFKVQGSKVEGFEGPPVSLRLSEDHETNSIGVENQAMCAVEIATTRKTKIHHR